MALNNVPLSGQTLLQTRDQINQNFITYIDTQFALDHVPLGPVTNGGLHNQVTFPVHSGATNPAANQLKLYNAAYAKSANANDIFLARSAGTPIPITAYRQSGSAQSNVGWCFLSSGLIMKWGFVSVTGGPGAAAASSFNIDANIPVFSAAPYSVQISPYTSGTQSVPYLSAQAWTATQFYVWLPAAMGNTGVRWVAIGPATV